MHRQLLLLDLEFSNYSINKWSLILEFSRKIPCDPRQASHHVASFIMNSHEVFNHIHQGCFAGTGAIVRLPQCQWSKPDGYGKISQCITTTKHSKAKTVCILIYCIIWGAAGSLMNPHPTFPLRLVQLKVTYSSYLYKLNPYTIMNSKHISI